MLTVTAEARHRIDAYLTKLRSRLRGVDEQDIRDIVEELRSHIIDKTEMAAEDRSVDKVGETLDALGSPEQLAAEYLTDNLLARAEVSRSPAHVLGVLFRLASLSIAGFLVFREFHCRVLLGPRFRPVRAAKANPSADSGIVDIPSRRRRHYDFSTAWFRQRSARR